MCMGLEEIIPHLLWRHQIKNWPFRCNLCDITFMMKHHFTEHSLVCKKKDIAHVGIKKSQTVSDTVKWRKNTNERNPEGGQLDSVPSQKIDEAAFLQTNKPSYSLFNRCKYCNNRYLHREMLDWHIEHCHGPDPKIKILPTSYYRSEYQCVLCEFKITKIESIIQHLLYEHQLSKLPYQCNICKCRQFVSKNLLMTHKLICSKTTLQVNYNDLQQPTKQISCQEIEDHTIAVKSGNDQHNLPEQQINV
ncbi:hypothetical protein B566_EDAN013683 [Ephemera danica]|nr:hypothetical protein B566_EDAN013683 [Ephemera danica]